MTSDFQPGDTVTWNHARSGLLKKRYTILCRDEQLVTFTDGSICRTSTIAIDYTKVEQDESETLQEGATWQARPKD